MGTLSMFPTLPLASAPWMSLSILLFLRPQGADVHANARFLRASERSRVHVCVSVRVCVCSWCVHVCEAASRLGPVDLSAAGPPGRGHPASLFLMTLSAGQKDHAAWTLPAGGLGPCPHGPVCGREVIGLCSWDLPGQRPSRRTKGKGLGQQTGAGCQEVSCSPDSCLCPGPQPHSGGHGLCEEVLARGELRTTRGPEPEFCHTCHPSPLELESR